MRKGTNRAMCVSCAATGASMFPMSHARTNIASDTKWITGNSGMHPCFLFHVFPNQNIAHLPANFYPWWKNKIYGQRSLLHIIASPSTMNFIHPLETVKKHDHWHNSLPKMEIFYVKYLVPSCKLFFSSVINVYNLFSVPRWMTFTN